MSKTHLVNCDKTCANHESISNDVASFKTAAIVIAAISSVILTICILLLTTTVSNLKAEDVELRQQQEKHETTIGQKTEKTLNEVRSMNTQLNTRMNAIEREQREIKGKNEQIIQYLKVLIEDRGITLLPGGKVHEKTQTR